MAEVTGLRLDRSVALKEKRLRALLGDRSLSDPGLRDTVADAQLLGSLELSGFGLSWAQVRARDQPLVAEVGALRAAQKAVDPAAPFSVAALRTWHLAAVSGGGRFRDRDLSPLAVDVAPPAPVPFIEGRLAILEEWMTGESARELKPAQAGALVLARLVEILPFAAGNGRVSRLAASHVMVGGGLRPPILVGGDRLRLEACLRAAFRLDTEPLATLLQEASERCLDVMIQSLEAAHT
ncbi:MAG TPA: Fic family protein [Vicinamibacteria bacterium]